jgi:hypothetical protein
MWSARAVPSPPASIEQRTKVDMLHRFFRRQALAVICRALGVSEVSPKEDKRRTVVHETVEKVDRFVGDVASVVCGSVVVSTLFEVEGKRG